MPDHYSLRTTRRPRRIQHIRQILPADLHRRHQPAARYLRTLPVQVDHPNTTPLQHHLPFRPRPIAAARHHPLQLTIPQNLPHPIPGPAPAPGPAPPLPGLPGIPQPTPVNNSPADPNAPTAPHSSADPRPPPAPPAPPQQPPAPISAPIPWKTTPPPHPDPPAAPSRQSPMLTAPRSPPVLSPRPFLSMTRS